jgi:predicted nucleic-acid-binding protein
MMITVDTNVLVRDVMRDDPAQGQLAAKVMAEADGIVITLSTLCEFVWVLRSTYRLPSIEIAKTIRTLLTVAKVKMNRPAVESGLSTLEAGGDFADGAIAHEGEWMGGNEFVSFDRKAVALLSRQGRSARLCT